MHALPHRALQMGLSREAVTATSRSGSSGSGT
ncbi:hypothetical protein [Herbidospora mongoliensis]|nr:hypothetical protein [Herbidospora mongoliensis]